MASEFSAEPGRTTANSDDIRWGVVWQRLVKKLSFVEIANNLNIDVETAHNVWTRFFFMGEVSARKQPPGYSKRKLDDYQKLLLIGLIMDQPHLYLWLQHILCTTGVEVSNATICRVLRKHDLTSRQVSQQRCIELQAKFRSKISFFSVDQFGRNRM